MRKMGCLQHKKIGERSGFGKHCLDKMYMPGFTYSEVGKGGHWTGREGNWQWERTHRQWDRSAVLVRAYQSRGHIIFQSWDILRDNVRPSTCVPKGLFIESDLFGAKITFLHSEFTFLKPSEYYFHYQLCRNINSASAFYKDIQCGIKRKPGDT